MRGEIRTKRGGEETEVNINTIPFSKPMCTRQAGTALDIAENQPGALHVLVLDFVCRSDQLG